MSAIAHACSSPTPGGIFIINVAPKLFWIQDDRLFSNRLTVKSVKFRLPNLFHLPNYSWHDRCSAVTAVLTDSNTAELTAMIELLITACLLTGSCQDFRLIYDAQEVSLMTCAMFGQAEVARWHRQHSSWQVKRWRCSYVEQRDEQV